MNIYVHKLQENAVVPFVAYNGTSAAMDITCVKETVIPAQGWAEVPNGLNVGIHEKDPYYMMVCLRSSAGFKRSLICHPGIIDAGYTGELRIKVYNVGTSDITIKEGERYAQLIVLHKIHHDVVMMSDAEWNTFSQEQQRGSNGFGSSVR